MRGEKAVMAEGEAAARERCLDGHKGRRPSLRAKDRHRMAEAKTRAASATTRLEPDLAAGETRHSQTGPLKYNRETGP